MSKIVNKKSVEPGSALSYLKIREVSKEFGNFTALSDVNIDIEEGEFVCFLGPSGCGKTTLLRAISGLDIQTRGTIHLGGVDISALPPSLRDFGIVFQSYALFPNLTVAQNVGYGLKNIRKMKKKKRKARVEELLELVGLSEQHKKYPAQLSGGQQQRVALVRALATSPSLLLLDEPLSALDAKVRTRLRNELKRLQRKLGITTIMVTHDQEEALAVADRIVVIAGGRVEQAGTPAEIYSQPETAFVADFIGEMNFLEATVSGPDSVRLGRENLVCNLEEIGRKEVGTKIRLAIRPEDISISDGGEEINRLRLNIENLEYLGTCCMAEMSGESLVAQRITGEFPINLVREYDLKNQMSLTVSLPPERLLHFPLEG